MGPCCCCCWGGGTVIVTLRWRRIVLLLRRNRHARGIVRGIRWISILLRWMRVDDEELARRSNRLVHSDNRNSRRWRTFGVVELVVGVDHAYAVVASVVVLGPVCCCGGTPPIWVVPVAEVAHRPSAADLVVVEGGLPLIRSPLLLWCLLPLYVWRIRIVVTWI